MGEVWDAPNQQVVRADSSAPWDEGEGGSSEEPEPRADPLDAMTKDELLGEALSRGLDVTAAMTKAEIRAAIDAAAAEG